MLVRTALICSLLGAATAQAAPTVEISGEHVVVDKRPQLSTDLLFPVGEATLTAPGKELLDAIAKAVAKDSGLTLVINAYTDNTAPDSDRTGVYLAKLSKDRATAVLTYLVKKGVAAKRMSAQGFGAEEPIGNNETDDGRAANRRLEILVKGQQVATGPMSAELAQYTRNLPGKGPLIAVIATSQGTLHCELFDQQAPMAVANFVGLATGQKAWTDPRTGKTEKSKFYDGLIFHRVIPQFMIQGGDPNGTGTGGPGYQFKDELAPGLKHQPGTLAMANAGPNTNGSQFFIDEIAASWLDNHHTIFGQCKELDVITKIASVPRDSSDKPVTPVVIQHITFKR